MRLGFMSFYIKAVVEALKRYPEVNASIDGEDVVYHNYFDVSIAVSTRVVWSRQYCVMSMRWAWPTLRSVSKSWP
nr:2-oxo acid dehydrogenase subunit E2 [Pectobacterium parmentieri]